MYVQMLWLPVYDLDFFANTSWVLEEFYKDLLYC